MQFSCIFTLKHRQTIATSAFMGAEMHENCILDFEQASELCHKQTNIKFIPEMFIEAEFKIFK